MNVIALLYVVPLCFSSQEKFFVQLSDQLSEEDMTIINQNRINTLDEYNNYLIKNNSSGNDSTSKSITNVLYHLENNYPDYLWGKEKKALTSDVSNAIPVEMFTESNPAENILPLYDSLEVEQALVNTGTNAYTSYGGCGPIAITGIIDYFSRYLGFNEISDNLNLSSNRIRLLEEVFSETHYPFWDGFNVDETLVWIWDSCSCFNTVMSNHHISNIYATSDWSLFGGGGSYYWNRIVDSVDNGLPVTLFVGLASGDGDFAKHYTNIYGYETWKGIKRSTGETITKSFIKARLNWGRSDEYYCDADILNDPQVGIITYHFDYQNDYWISAQDFSSFVNQNGEGQYFFNSKSQQITLSNQNVLSTNRLRTSFIENRYLVMSPNRKNAGHAYLDIEFPHNVQKITFRSALWSNSENNENQIFRLEYYDNSNNYFIEHIPVDLYNLSTNKNSPGLFTVIFPKNTNRIRFNTIKMFPGGDRNKGRICLDSFNVSYF